MQFKTIILHIFFYLFQFSNKIYQSEFSCLEIFKSVKLISFKKSLIAEQFKSS